jgi:glycosyltransferase involved in cell wall biosynthesis
MNEKILVLIPMYNCEKQITRVIAQLKGDVISYVTELIIVDNGSTDNSVNAALEAIKGCALKASVRQNNENYNLGGSHKVAFQYAIDNAFDYLIVLHGDDQGNIEDIIPILKSAAYRDADMTLGSRFMKGSSLLGYSRFRTFGNIVYNMLFSLVLFRHITDLGSGLNMYKVKSLEGGWWLKLPDKLSFNYAMLLASVHIGQKQKFFPITWREDDQVSNVKMARQAIETLLMLAKYFFLRGKYINGELRKNIIQNYDSRLIGTNT